MSIENEIKELTGAIKLLTVQLSEMLNDVNFGKIAAPSTQSSTGTVAGVNGSTSEEKPKRNRTKPAETKAAEAPAEESFEDSTTGTTAAADDEFDLGLEDEPAAPEVTEAELKKICGDVSKKKGRETILRLFKDFGAATFGDVKPDQYGKMYAAAKELLG